VRRQLFEDLLAVCGHGSEAEISSSLAALDVGGSARLTLFSAIEKRALGFLNFDQKNYFALAGL
jgi:hypothetical protein